MLFRISAGVAVYCSVRCNSGCIFVEFVESLHSLRTLPGVRFFSRRLAEMYTFWQAADAGGGGRKAVGVYQSMEEDCKRSGISGPADRLRHGLR